jgi:hypothetical protein
MRIYEGSPRQDWEEVLRCIGAFADRAGLRDLLLLELQDGFLLQGLALASASSWSEAAALHKETHELDDERIAELMDERAAQRAGGADASLGPTNFYEQALRVIGGYIDQQRAHDVFFFEQDGSFVVRLLHVGGQSGSGHSLAEFTRDDIIAMIGSGPDQRHEPAPPPP